MTPIVQMFIGQVVAGAGMHRQERWVKALALCVSLLLSAGCSTLPDAKPFADATRSLTSSVTASGLAISASFDEAMTVDAAAAAEYKRVQQELDAAWAPRVKAMKASVAYAEAVTDLVSAGQQGAESVTKVADSLSGLAGVLSIPVTGPAVSVAGDVARFLADRIAYVRAAGKLETALERAQPAVDRLADLMVVDLDTTLTRMLKDLHKNTVSAIKSQYESEDNFVRKIALAHARQREMAIKEPVQLRALRDFDQSVESADLRLKERDRRLEASSQMARSRSQLLQATSAAVGAWAQDHRDLAAALKDKRKVNVVELQSTIAEMKLLIKKVNEL